MRAKGAGMAEAPDRAMGGSSIIGSVKRVLAFLASARMTVFRMNRAARAPL